MADRQFSINVNITGEAGSLSDALRDSTQAVFDFKGEVNRLARDLASASASVRGARDNIKALGVDAGYAERALASLTNWVRSARDNIKDLAGESAKAVGSVRAMRDSSDDLAAAQAELAGVVRAASESLSEQGFDLEKLAALMTVTRDATDSLATEQERATVAAEMEARAIDEVGEAAERTTLKLEALGAAQGMERDIGGGMSLFEQLNLLHTLPKTQEALRYKAPDYMMPREQNEQLSLLSADMMKLAGTSSFAGQQLNLFAIESDHAGSQALRAAADTEVFAAAMGRLGDHVTVTQMKLASMRGTEMAAGGVDWGGLLYHRGNVGRGGPFRMGRMLGVFGAGGLLPMTGIGPERFLTAGMSLAGTALGGIAGGGLLAAGEAGRLAVGGGSDAAMMKSTITDVGNLEKAYENLHYMQEVYGKGSRQAADAQAQLNLAMAQAGPASKIELAVAEKLFNITDEIWHDKAVKARTEATSIINQFADLLGVYIPHVIAAATTNLGIINDRIKPLFSFLKTQGISIFNDLENSFAKHLPVAIDAATNAFELLLKTVDYVSNTFLTGGFTTRVDQFFRYWNSTAGIDRWHTEINKLVDDFRVWEHFIGALMHDIVGLFKVGDGEGKKMLVLFTQWLNKFGEWEHSVKGSAWLREFFKARTDELLALLRILPPIITMMGHFYMSLQPLVPVWTALAKLISAFLGDLMKISPAAGTAIGALLLMRRYFTLPMGGGGGGGGGANMAEGALIGGAAGAAGAAATSDIGLVTGIVDKAAGVGGLTTSMTAMFEGGMVGGVMGGFSKISGLMDKYGPLMKLGLAFWVGSGILSGIEQGFSGHGNVFQKAGNSLLDSIKSILGPGLTNTILGAFGAGPLSQIGTTAGVAKTAIEGMQKALSGGSWADVFRTLDGLKLHMYEAGGASKAALAQAIQSVNAFIQSEDNLKLVTPAMAQKIILSFQQVKDEGGSAIQNMNSVVQANMAMIASDIGTKSAQAKQALALNFATAAQYMEQNYVKMGVSTAKAMQFIEGELVKALKALGVNAPKGMQYGSSGDIAALQTMLSGALAGFTISPGAAFSLHARGGILGNPDAAGPDMYHVIMGEGEAVITRHQRAAIDANLPGGMTVGGVVGAIRKPNYAASGFVAGEPIHAAHGMVSGGNPTQYVFPFPKGAPFSWQRIDQGQDMEASPGTPVVAIGPGSVSVGHDAYTGFGPFYPIEYLSGGPWAGRSVYYGHAKDTRTGPVSPGDIIGYTQSRADEWTMAPAGWLEFGFTTALGAGIHGQGAEVAPMLHALAQGHMVQGIGGALGTAGAIVAQKLGDYTIKDLGSGLIDKIAQAEIEQYRTAAQAFLQRQVGAMNTGAGFTGGGSNAANQALGHKMMLAFGWPESQWPALQALWTQESSWDSGPGSVNPSSGAYGIPQANPSGGAGHPYALNDPAGQIAWGLRYIRSRYGTPAAAEAHELAYHWYESGGLPGKGEFMSAYKGGSPKSKVGKGTGIRHPSSLKGVKTIPNIPELTSGFEYLFDRDRVKPDVLTGKSKLTPYTGGNAAAIDRAGGTDWEYLTGLLGLVDDTDAQGNPILDPKYAYGAGTWYQNDPANPQGYAGVWKLDQEIAARLGILMMEQGELSHGPGQLKKLGKFVHHTEHQLTGLVHRAQVEAADLKKWQNYSNYLKLQKSKENFVGERLKIHQEFAIKRFDLLEKKLKGRLTLNLMFNEARGILDAEKHSELSALAAANILDPTSKEIEYQSIVGNFDARLNHLSSLKDKLSTTQQIDNAKARLFLTLAEEDSLYAISRREHGYTQKGVQASLAISKDKTDLHGIKGKATILLNDLLAADENSEGHKLAGLLQQIGLDSSLGLGPITVTSGGFNDIRSEIQGRIAQLTDDARMERNVTIPGLEKDRNAISGGSTTGAANQSFELSLIEQILQYAGEDLSVTENQLAQLASFAPLLGQMVGQYAHGGIITQTGYALVHRGEEILSDPEGPYGSQASATIHTTETPVYELHLHGSIEALEPYIEMVVRRKGERIIAQQSGRAARILAGAPGY